MLCTIEKLQENFHVQKRAVRIILNAVKIVRCVDPFSKLVWIKITTR